MYEVISYGSVKVFIVTVAVYLLQFPQQSASRWAFLLYKPPQWTGVTSVSRPTGCLEVSMVLSSL